MPPNTTLIADIVVDTAEGSSWGNMRYLKTTAIIERGTIAIMVPTTVHKSITNHI
jgi:hypothetical protein